MWIRGSLLDELRLRDCRKAMLDEVHKVACTIREEASEAAAQDGP